MNFYNFNEDLMLDFNWFLYKINERSNIEMGFIRGDYINLNRHSELDWGLDKDVEYFHPTITLDDRMRYIAESISRADISDNNIMCNALISHFYGARGIHQQITASTDPDDCWVDFDRIANEDMEYVKQLDTNLRLAISNKQPIWGTTELHTWIQTAARNFVIEKYNQKPRSMKAVDVCMWVADFINKGYIDALYQSNHIEDAYNVLIDIKGVGDYYAFHGSASTSVLQQTKYTHDDRFVAPGPGAQYMIKLMWPDIKRSDHAESVYFLRENGDEIGLTKNVEFHPNAYNINGLFREDQDGLKYYGTEVLCCQFGIYLQIRDNLKACENRKVSRSTSFGKSGNLEGFFS